MFLWTTYRSPRSTSMGCFGYVRPKDGHRCLRIEIVHYVP